MPGSAGEGAVTTGEPQIEPRRRSRVFRLTLAAAGVLVVLAILALLLGWIVTLRSVEQQAQGPGGEFSDIQIGQPAPDFRLYAVDETPTSLSDFRGSIVALNFWATWCLPCALEIPALNRAAEAYADDGLVVLGVNQGEPPSQAIAYLEERGVTYTNLLDPYQETGELYDVVGMPITVWIGPDGRVLAVDYGALNDARIARQMETIAGENGATGTP